MKTIINMGHNTPFLQAIFHTLIHEIKGELADCETVLDLGCGPKSPIGECRWLRRSVGVEAYEPYIELSKKRGIHSEYIQGDITRLEFEPGSFDAVTLIDVIEHMEEEEALKVIRKAEIWAKKKVLISSPNGFVEQMALDGNKLQEHLSGWDYDKMKSMGFSIKGMAGLKYLRGEVEGGEMGDDIRVSIKYRPKTFWFFVSTLSQLFTFWFPSQAYSLFSVKHLGRNG